MNKTLKDRKTRAINEIESEYKNHTSIMMSQFMLHITRVFIVCITIQ